MPIKTVAFDTPTEMATVKIVINDIVTNLTKVHVVTGGVPTTVFNSIPAISMITPSLVVLSDTTSSITFRMTNNELAGTGSDAYFYYEIWNDAETVRINNANTILDGGTAPQGTIDKSFSGLSSDTFYKLRVYSEDVLFVKTDSSFSAFVRNKTDTPPVTHTVIFENYDQSFLDQDTNIPNGGTAVYGGSTPTRAGSTWTGWDSPLTNITSSQTITATFKIDTPTNLDVSPISGIAVEFSWNAVTNADDYRTVSPDTSVIITSDTVIEAERGVAGTFRVVARASGFEDSDEATIIYDGS